MTLDRTVDVCTAVIVASNAALTAAQMHVWDGTPFMPALFGSFMCWSFFACFAVVIAEPCDGDD